MGLTLCPKKAVGVFFSFLVVFVEIDQLQASFLFLDFFSICLHLLLSSSPFFKEENCLLLFLNSLVVILNRPFSFPPSSLPLAAHFHTTKMLYWWKPIIFALPSSVPTFYFSHSVSSSSSYMVLERISACSYAWKPFCSSYQCQLFCLLSRKQ